MGSGTVQFRESIKYGLKQIFLFNSSFSRFAIFFQLTHFYFWNIEGNFVLKSLGLLGGFLYPNSLHTFNSPCFAIPILAVFLFIECCCFLNIDGSFVIGFSKSLVFLGECGFLLPEFFFLSKYLCLEAMNHLTDIHHFSFSP